MNTLKILTLQIKRPNFEYILTGEQKTEHRDIYPSNANRYVRMASMEDGTTEVEAIQYDALKLINGRRPDAPSLIVKVESAEWVCMGDKDGKPLTYVENGQTYLVAQVWYHLGEVIHTEHVDEKFEFKYAGVEAYDFGLDDRPLEEREKDEAEGKKDEGK